MPAGVCQPRPYAAGDRQYGVGYDAFPHEINGAAEKDVGLSHLGFDASAILAVPARARAGGSLDSLVKSKPSTFAWSTLHQRQPAHATTAWTSWSEGIRDTLEEAIARCRWP